MAATGGPDPGYELTHTDDDDKGLVLRVDRTLESGQTDRTIQI